MPFLSNMTDTTAVDNSIQLAYDAGFLVATGQANVLDQFVEYRADIGAKSIEFPRYSRLALATTPLTETDDVTPVAMSDSQVILTPAEYGAAVVTTALADIQTGGKSGLGAVRLAGINMGQTRNRLATAALEASSNSFIAGTAGTEAGLAAGDIMSGVILNKVYNKLSRANVDPLADGMYVALMHDDVMHDLRAESGWVDVAKYADAVSVLKNEVGMYKGFRIVRNNDAAFADQSGAGTVDMYKSSFLGFNGLGLAVSKEPRLIIKPTNDLLNRFMSVGWHGVFQYKIVEPNAVWTVGTASSVGANAA
jgi:N4-gp56 family major capsid protein